MGCAMKIVIGADHRGYICKEHIKNMLPNYEWIDVGAHTGERSDYPEFAHAAIHSMQKEKIEHAILLCGSGIGIAIAANRYENILAGVAWNVTVARQAKAHDNVNVLVLPCDYISHEESVIMITTWLTTEFLGGRYAKRIAMIEKEPA